MFKRGFSLLEMLIVIAIMTIILAVIIIPLSSLRNRQALNSGAEELVSLISQARSKTIAAVAGANHGVHLNVDDNKAELFQGDSYPGTTIQILAINPALTLSDISLDSGGDDIIFEKISGTTGQFGSLTLTLNSDSTQERVIIIEPTGVVYVRQ